MVNKCSTCVYAQWNYEAHDGGAKRWFWDGCAKDHEDPEDDDCEDWEEAGTK